MIDEAEVTEGCGTAHEPAVDVGTLRGVLDLAIETVDAEADSPARLAAWRELKRAHAERLSVPAHLLLTLEPGAFVQLHPGVYGFAPRVELPAWVPRHPQAASVGRELVCVVMALEEQAGVALVSPRLWALRRVRAAMGGVEQVQGTVISTATAGIVVDLDGARGFLPVTELSPSALLSASEPDSSWQGYVIGMADTGPLLSHHPPAVRARRERARTEALARLAPGAVAAGRVVKADADGALVTFEDGLVWGTVPRAALRSPAGRRLARGATASLRVLEQHDTDPVALRLWPAA